MLKLGQKVVVIGDNFAAVGTEVEISHVMPCDNGAAPTTFVYGVSPSQFRNGLKLFFQEKHLMPLEQVEVHDYIGETIFA